MVLRWGILGAGNISGLFAHDLVLSNKKNAGAHVITSIGSSNVKRGQEFIARNEITPDNNQGYKPVVEDYLHLYANPDVDIIYIGTPHTLHHEQIVCALKHGKHVLCEKPFTVTGAEARAVFELAEQCNLFVMEATWTRFFPLIARARQLLYEERVLGTVHRLNADFSMNADIRSIPKSSRARDIRLAAGATLDIGIYPLTYARILLDESGNSNFSVKSVLSLDPEDGVDHLGSYLVKYDDGKQAVLTCSNYTDGPTPFLRLEGSKGQMSFHAESNPAQPQSLTVTFKDGSPDIRYEDDIMSSGYLGYIYEANAAARCIEEGKRESNTMLWQETLLMLDTMDKIRWENDLYYDGESKPSTTAN